MKGLITISYTNINFYFLTAIFLLALLIIQKFIRNSLKSNQIKKGLLLIFSFFIICTYDWSFCIWILLTGAITYISGVLIERQEQQRYRVKVASVTALCLILGFFKYFNSVAESIASILGRNSSIQVLFPIGLSFYIFSAISYVIDVANRKISAEKSFSDMILFLAFFPKIVCGPIAKAREFLPQLKEEQRITFDKFQVGIQLLLIGLFKKIVLADHLALFVNAVYEKPAIYTTGTVWLAGFTYFMQMYLDFSGYSDMAVGLSKILGYELPQNFNLPFISRNITDFWNRWHISLTSWLTEYVFNPTALFLRRQSGHLSKEKKKKLRVYFTYLSIVITFLVSGIWHGVGMVYLAWGLCHGIISVIHAAYTTWMRQHHPDFAKNKPTWVVAVDIFCNLFVVILLEIFFRANTFSAGLSFFYNMFTIHGGIRHSYVWSFVALAVLALSAVVAHAHKKKLGLQVVESYYPMQDLHTVRGLSIFFIFSGLTIILGYFGESFFIYGNF